MRLSKVIFLMFFTIVFFKYVVPFTNSAIEKIRIYSSLEDLITSLRDIRMYYQKNGEFDQISKMTYVKNYKDLGKLEFSKPVEYGFDYKGKKYYCIDVKPVLDDKLSVYLIIDKIEENNPVCKKFYNSLEEEKLCKFLIQR